MDSILRYFRGNKERRSTDLGRSPLVGSETVFAYVRAVPLQKFSEITINPKPDYVVCLEENDIRDKIEMDLRKIILRSIQYLVYHKDLSNDTLERLRKVDYKILLIGEHGSEGLCKLHYHGIIGGFPNDVLHLFIKAVRARMGNTHLGYIRNEKLYREYMLKSYTGNTPECWGYSSYIPINIDFNIE